MQVSQAPSPAKTVTIPAAPIPKVTKEVVQAAADAVEGATTEEPQMFFYDTTTGKLYPVKSKCGTFVIALIYSHFANITILMDINTCWLNKVQWACTKRNNAL